ncbi:iron complex transport system ATP-binding protein [Parageobacillus thermantarcticus]|uniref:Iron complex transport system ATP-binding protein n=1 Tax=Parageobacillus thermantarcticus TaxID=186116 RepID=A0A1I0TMK8_9BACL|nr:ABC transporter ATP-binding protein [Parageobacillus thermantarcticus]SFA53048.1 iron complex transport system ATP-binding protein [Parageobacillus thermantarcticus]
MKHIISMKNVSLIRGNRVILKDINWEVKEKEQWVILGLNGSGKTSILNIVTGYQYPTKGEVSVLGKKFGQANLPELRKQIGFVSSALDRFHQTLRSETVEDIVISGKFATIGLYENVTNEDRERAEQLMTFLRIDHLKGKTYDTLSQGERRKVLIGRALMAEPELLILDEPSIGLDLLAREDILSLMKEIILHQQCHVLYVTHYIGEIIEEMTHVLLLKEGQIVAAGRKEDVLTEERLSETFQLPVKVHWENNRPWASIHKNIGSATLAKAESK